MFDDTSAQSVSEFIENCSNLLKYNYETAVIEGEVASFKINQGKYVFFDLKEGDYTLPCFMWLSQFRTELEDGMKVRIVGQPEIKRWGKFSFTVKNIIPVGEGSIKKQFELLKKKLAAEGLFDPAHKRPLPAPLSKIGVISSTQAAGYADFIKIINERYGGLSIQTAHTQVQGITAAGQIIRALKYFNEHTDVQVVAIIRGGGSADDLACFNDEALARAIFASKIPVITGIGHEVDESLADLVADLRGSTPSNVAQMLTPDRRTEIVRINNLVQNCRQSIFSHLENAAQTVNFITSGISREIVVKITTLSNEIDQKIKLLAALNPEKVLKQGYAIISGKISPGNVVKITTFSQIINAEVKNVENRH